MLVQIKKIKGVMILKKFLFITISLIIILMAVSCDTLGELGKGVVDESKKELSKTIENEIDTKLNTVLDGFGIKLPKNARKELVNKIKEDPKSLLQTSELKKLVIISFANSAAKSNNVKLTDEELNKIVELSLSNKNKSNLSGYITKLIIDSSKNR
jgi:hypothetical protein